MPEKQKSALKKFLVFSDVLVIFTSLEQMEISCEAKNKSLIMFTL